MRLSLSLLIASLAAGGCAADKPTAAPDPAPAPAAASASAPAPAPVPTPTSASTPATAPSPSPAPKPAPTQLHVPASIGAGKHPFVLFLHGLGASGSLFGSSLGVSAVAETRRFVWAAPDGALDSRSRRYWNASSSCCDLDGARPDHLGELRELLARAARDPHVDPQKLFVVGFSNGGFMAHRLACDVPAVAGIVSIAGAGPNPGDAACTPAHPVAVLQIHGDADSTVPYAGGHPLGNATIPVHPGAVDTVTAWASRDGCTPAPSPAGRLDLEGRLAGDETEVLRFAGCKKPVELWTVRGGGHVLGGGRAAIDLALDFLDRSTSP